MINAIIIESVMILILGFIFYLTVKRNIALKNELSIKKKALEQVIDNGNHYREIIKKLNDREVESNEVKKQIDTASGADLAALANSL